jgi:hypothetical protein
MRAIGEPPGRRRKALIVEAEPINDAFSRWQPE